MADLDLTSKDILQLIAPILLAIFCWLLGGWQRLRKERGDQELTALEKYSELVARNAEVTEELSELKVKAAENQARAEKNESAIQELKTKMALLERENAGLRKAEQECREYKQKYESAMVEIKEYQRVISTLIVLSDAMTGAHSVDAAMMETAWQILDPVLDTVHPLRTYLEKHRLHANGNGKGN